VGFAWPKLQSKKAICGGFAGGKRLIRKRVARRFIFYVDNGEDGGVKSHVSIEVKRLIVTERATAGPSRLLRELISPEVEIKSSEKE
jgi:hypothetical protein